MKRSLIFFAAVAICAASCGTVGEFSDADRFQDGIYYKPDPRMVGREPLREEEFKYLASMDNFRSQLDSSQILEQPEDDLDSFYDRDSYWRSWHPYGYWNPYYYSYLSYYSPYWDYSPYWWGYDPYWWGYGRYPGYYGYYGYYGYGYPYYYGYGYGYYGYPYHRGYYHTGTYSRRTGSATSGYYARPATSGGISTGGRVASAARSASAMAQRDLDRIKVQRTGHKTTAVNRETAYPETSNYRTISATRASSNASYNSDRNQRSSTYYESSSSSRSVSSSRSSGYSGGGHSSSSSHSSHSSGGGGYHGGGHR